MRLFDILWGLRMKLIDLHIKVMVWLLPERSRVVAMFEPDQARGGLPTCEGLTVEEYLATVPKGRRFTAIIKQPEGVEPRIRFERFDNS
jgi:hypothetical protein